MEDLKEGIVSQLHSVMSRCSPMDAYSVMQEVIEEAQSLQDDCLKMEYAFGDTDYDEE